MKTLCGCRGERVRSKEKYKLKLTTKAYKLSYNYIKPCVAFGEKRIQTKEKYKLKLTVKA
jgi:hypothetical protein